MPLIHSSSDAAFKKNLKAELSAGKPRDQALAIAYRVKRERADGGSTPWFAKNQARSMTHSGPISSIVPGRTDHIGMRVPAGAYVVPAETVSHLGQNNTAAGFSVLSRMFSSGPYGVTPMGIKKGSLGMKRKRADGGEASDDTGSPVPIYAAGGEYVIPPEAVAAVGDGDLDRGHKVLDAWIMSLRKQHIKTLKSLSPPAKD